MPATLIFALYLILASAAAPGDAECLACHGEKEMKSASGRSIYVDPAKHRASVHGSIDCQACHTDIKEYPHPKSIAHPRCATCHAAAVEKVPKSIHGKIFPAAQACANCHGSVHEVRRAGVESGQECASCHAEVIRDYKLSVHFAARKNGYADSPLCLTCHGPAHSLVARSDPASPVAKKNLPNTCGSCHANPDFLARHQIPFARPVEAYRLSVHGRAVARGNQAGPSCSDCHSNHAIFNANDTRSKINHWNVPETCGTCHADIKKTYQESVHGRAVKQGVRDAPVCTDCHGEHIILAPSEPRSLVNPARVSSATCGRCHADERLTQRYNLPTDKVLAFRDSYHGLALRSGSQVVANCASCHGVHNILPSNDPRSTVNAANLAHTCGACHPGAGASFAIGAIHVRRASANEHPVVKWIRVTYWVLIPLTLGFMLLHNGLDFFAKLIRSEPRTHSGEQVVRMNLNFRIAHWLVMLSFPVLVATGFALKFPESWWAEPLLLWESRFALRGTLHRAAAVVLIASMVYHFIHLLASRRDRRILQLMVPRIQDVFDILGTARYNLGLSAEPPTFGKFNYVEKLEYLAFVWGAVVMGLSGFLLWFNNFTLRHFPKWVADAATAVHYYEAILATLSILIWHFYVVMFDPDVYPMDLSWLTGKASADHLRHTRPAYYLQLVREQRDSHAAGSDAKKVDAAPSSEDEARPVPQGDPKRTTGSDSPPKPSGPGKKPPESS